MVENHSSGHLAEQHSSEHLIENPASKHSAELAAEAKEKFNEILQFSLSPTTKKPHKFEKMLFILLLALGKIFLQIFFDALGNGDVGSAITADDGRILKRCRIRKRDYISIFGKVFIKRWYY